ncbi:MAG: polyprenyl synthetase family protein [Planctomycetota bacterium]
MTEADGAPRGFDRWLAESRTWAERALEACLDERLGAGAHVLRSATVPDPQPASGLERLNAALRYAVLGAGKRVRPALVRLACRAHGGSDAAAAPAAVAVELVHAYSLVHDDLPCMDDDDLRRGRPTVHRAYDEATAVLVGDGLQTLAFEHLARRGGPRAAEAIVALAVGAGPAGMVGGQALDLAAEGVATDVAGARQIHLLKTAALLGASAELGALAAGAGAAQRAACRAFGVQLGLLFQAVDDLLDVTGDAATLGKTPGKDVAEGKGTVVAALGLAGARRVAEELAAAARAAGRSAGLDSDGYASGFVERMLARRA